MPFIIELCPQTSSDPALARLFFRAVANPSDPTDYSVTSNRDRATEFADLDSARAALPRSYPQSVILAVNDPESGSAETTRRALLGFPSEAKIVALTNALRAAGATMHRDGDGVKVALADGSTVSVL